MTPDIIIIHCSATRCDRDTTVEQIDKMHKERGFRKIGYHYYIRKDGTICQGRNEDEPGAHCLGWNQHSIGICYEGGLNEKSEPSDTRTPEQKAALVRLIIDVATRNKDIKRVIGHRDTSPDKNGNGKIEPFEYIKQCPCFDASDEYRKLLP